MIVRLPIANNDMLTASVEYDAKDWLEAVEVILDKESMTQLPMYSDEKDRCLLESPEEMELVVRWLNENATKAIKLNLPAPEYMKDMRMIALLSMNLLPVKVDTPEQVDFYLEKFIKIRDYARRILHKMEKKEAREKLDNQDGECEQDQSEEQKIQQLIEEYRDFLVNQGIDVARSVLKNRWFCYQYNEQYKYYDFYTEFSTAKELADIILNQLTFEMELEEGKEKYPPELNNSNIADVVTVYCRHNYILVLEKLLQRLLNTELGKNSDFFKALDKLLTYARKETQ